MAHALESAVEWPPQCLPFVERLRAVLPADVDAQAARALSTPEYQARAGELRAMLAETGGENARMRTLRTVLGKLLGVVALLYDYLKTTVVASRNVYKELGGLVDEIDLALAHIVQLSTGVDKKRAGWDSKDTYMRMIVDFRYNATHTTRAARSVP